MSMPSSVIDISTINEKQKLFFKSRTKYTGYGGARAGGKSWSVQRKSSLLALRYGGIKILLLRRSYKELERNHVRFLIPLLKGIAHYQKQDKLFTFPNGSIIELGYCDSENDVLQYQGQEYDAIFLDEATQFTEFQFQTLTACLRGANEFPKRFYITANPGGVGHEWVKRLFVSRKYKEGEKPEDYTFIQANVYDNKVMLEKDPDYVHQLEALDEDLRDIWLYGNWDAVAGQYFNEFDRSVHVCEPFSIPEHWNRYRTMDYGLDCAAFLWVAIDERGRKYVYREYAEEDKPIAQCSKEVIELSEGETYVYTAAPDDMWGRTADEGKRKADLFYENGLNLTKVSRDRESGWLAIKNEMQVHEIADGVKEADIVIFSNCTKLIECLPALQRSQKKPNDCMTEPHDITHLPDALRYFCLYYHRATKPLPKEQTELDKMKANAIKRITKNNRSQRLW